MNEVGRRVVNWWRETENKFPHVELDEYVLMPNHIHGIVVIVGADLCVRRNAKIANRTNINDEKKINSTKTRADTQVRPYKKSFNGSRR